MDLSDFWSNFSSRLLALTNPAHRPLRMRFLATGGALEEIFIAHSVDILERLNEGVEGRIICLSPNRTLQLNAFEGVPVEVQFTTDSGSERVVRAIITRAARGMADDKLALYQFTLIDPLTLLDQYIDTYAVTDATVLEVTDELLGNAIRACPGLGASFNYVWRVETSRYRRRAFWLQRNESLSRYLRSQWARFGISFFFSFDADGRTILVLFDDMATLDANAAGTIRFHRQDGAQPRDTISHFAEGRQLTNGCAELLSYDYKSARMNATSIPTLANHGSVGQAISPFLSDRRITMPHVGDDTVEFERMNKLRIERHEFESAWACGMSSVRQLAVGESNCIDDLPGRQFEPAETRTYVCLEVHHLARNDLGELSAHVAQLLDASEQLKGWEPMGSVEDLEHHDGSVGRYANRFVAALKGTPLVPRWEEVYQAHRLLPMTAMVAGADGREIDIDDQGRVLVVIPGESTGRKTARVRFNSVYAGYRQGVWMPLKVGMEVSLMFEGDESRPVITGVRYNGASLPPHFDHAGSVSANRHLAGMHLHEIGNTRYGELLFDLTTGQISVSLGSEHARSRLQLGLLHGTRRDGDAPPIGDGFYLHTQAAGALRTAQALLLSACGRKKDSALQLDMQEHITWLEQGIALLDGLAKDAEANRGLPMDTKARAALHDDVVAALGGSNVDPNGKGGAPTINLTAPAGISATTPKTILQYAGVNIDAVAGFNLQLTSGQNTVINSGKGMSLFAHADGLRFIARQGPLLLQSQHGDTRIEASGDMTLAAMGTLRLQAKEIIAQTEDGTYVRLAGGSPTIGGTGPMNVKTSGHNWGSTDSMPANLPSFNAPKALPICIECLLSAAAAGAPVAMK